MAQFVANQTIETPESEIEVTVTPQAPLPVGRNRFQLVVVDDSGNVSEPDVVEVIVKDTSKPTAVLQAPREVNVGQSFQLTGKQSFDMEEKSSDTAGRCCRGREEFGDSKISARGRGANLLATREMEEQCTIN